ncbi:MAG: transglycosylase SLT domain-containing protein [Thermodesulfovibrionales bacterium]
MPNKRSVWSKPRRILPAVLVVCLCVGSGSAEEPQPGAALGLLKQGTVALEAGRYDEAIPALSRAADEIPLLPDYALWFLAEAYHRSGRHADALITVRAILNRYPQTPLRKKARGLELREAAESEPDAVTGLYESYLKAYPDDEEAMYAFALHLKNNGLAARAKGLFRKLYVRAGARAGDARQELAASDITASDVLERSSSLLKKFDFDDAERELRALLANSPANRTETQKLLATALFKQKKYREAADMYERTGDLYFRTRSLYRAGEKARFDASLQELIRRGDQSAGYILNAVAADKRRERDFDAAARIYRDVQKTYPAEQEEASWGLGWTLFTAGRLEEAGTVFALLHEKHNDPKYLYWQARCLEALGGDPAPLYEQLMKTENNFYGMLAFARTKTVLAQRASLPRQTISPLSAASRRNERVDALLALDMRSEAIAELSDAARDIGSSAEIEYLLAKYAELGEYNRAIRLATKLPYTATTHSSWYPLAYWETVAPVSRKYGIDPSIVLSVMREESRFDPAAKSPAGAYGLMQLMPQTAYRLDRSLRMGISRPAQLTNPRNNIRLGVYYLSLLLDEFGHSLPHALAAYNAGEAAVRNWVQRCGNRPVDEFIEEIPYAETRTYVKKVLTSYFQYRRSVQEGPSGEPFDVLADSRANLDIP